MSLIYADTSALARAYFADEKEHAALRAMLLEGSDPVVTSELARLELSSAVRAAQRARRHPSGDALLNRFDIDCGPDGPILLLRLRPDPVLTTARRLVAEHALRTLDAIHLAVVLEDVAPLAGPDSLVVVTRDDAQATAARALGFEVR